MPREPHFEIRQECIVAEPDKHKQSYILTTGSCLCEPKLLSDRLEPCLQGHGTMLTSPAWNLLTRRTSGRRATRSHEEPAACMEKLASLWLQARQTQVADRQQQAENQQQDRDPARLVSLPLP